MLIRSFNSNDIFQIDEIIHSLHPKWFDEKALKNIPVDVQLGITFVAEHYAKIAGFINISSLEGKTWINWMGVNKINHGKGVGTELLIYAENKLRQIGVVELHVDTVVEQTPADGSYDKTVRFYIKNGYEIIERREIKHFENFIYRRGVLRKHLKQ